MYSNCLIFKAVKWNYLKVISENFVRNEKLSSKAVEPNCQTRPNFQMCLKSHSRRAGRAELVSPRQISKTDSAKFSRREIRSRFVCLSCTKLSSLKFVSVGMDFQRTKSVVNTCLSVVCCGFILCTITPLYVWQNHTIACRFGCICMIGIIFLNIFHWSSFIPF